MKTNNRNSYIVQFAFRRQFEISNIFALVHRKTYKTYFLEYKYLIATLLGWNLFHNLDAHNYYTYNVDVVY